MSFLALLCVCSRAPIRFISFVRHTHTLVPRGLKEAIMASKQQLFQALLLASSLGWNGVFADRQQYGGPGMSESGLVLIPPTRAAIGETRQDEMEGFTRASC